jgi:pimeloyl-ACP methyl ester carboxylesterase
MNKKLLILISIPVLFILFIFSIAWYFSGQVLYPPWKARDLSECKQNFIDEEWGPDCGNLRMNKQYAFSEVRIESENGMLSGWHVSYNANRDKRAVNNESAMFFFHGGGADRRQGFRYVDFFLNRGYDVYLFDMSGHGESTSRIPEISLGEREYKDAIAAYEYLKTRYKKIIGMGTSMGGVSILNAIDRLSGIKAIIVENPFYSPERFIRETPQASSLPQWIKLIALKMIYFRGKFSAQHSPGKSIILQSKIPILFIHSKKDIIVPYQHSEELYQSYHGPKKILLTDSGLHAAIWKSHREIFERTMDEFLKSLRN